MAERQIFRIVIAGSQDAIFREIASTDRPLGAIYNSRMHTTGLKAGERMQMRTVGGGHVMVVGEILECDPPRRFSHTHRFTQHDDPVCHVTYDLKPVAGGVEVTLTLDNVTAGTKSAKAMASGGDFILKNLKAIVESGRPPLGTRMLYFMFGAMEFVLPARTKTEHWPLEKK